MEKLLEVKDLNIAIKKDLKTLTAVEGISFHIDKGEIVGLAGESGCGKSMTALSIPNLLPAKAEIIKGGIIFEGRDLVTLSENEMCAVRGKEISVIFQETKQALNPLMKIGRQITENVRFASGINNKTNKRRALEMLHQLGFDDAKKIYNAYPHQLSGGMCQRVMAAIAAINHPALLIADEPSSSLDAESQNSVLSLLVEMNREYNTAVLIISHDLSIIQKYCSRFLVMYAGKIVEEGSSASLFSPAHPYTKALINSIPAKERKGSHLENIPGKVPSIEDDFTGCPFSERCKDAQSICSQAFPPVKETENSKVYCYFPQGEPNAGK
jgi:peptide/nickel transport system ATP-binding protein